MRVDARDARDLDCWLTEKGHEHGRVMRVKRGRFGVFFTSMARDASEEMVWNLTVLRVQCVDFGGVSRAWG
jgi:hypothetical protein